MEGDDVEEALEDLPPSSKFIYKTLDRSGPMTLKGLTEETLLSSRTARYGLDQLEEAGLLESSPALHDGRQTCYRLGADTDDEADDQQTIVTAEWVRDRLEEFERDDPEFRLVEADDEYDRGHVPGAVRVDIMADLVDVDGCGLADRETFERYVGERGITEDSTVVIYSVEENQYAAYLYWLFKYYRHTDVRLLDGGKRSWEASGYPMTTDESSVAPREYVAQPADDRIRAYRTDIEAALARDVTIVDVRSSAEFRGERASPPGELPEARTAGHIPGTVHVQWSEVIDDEGRFKESSELEQLFRERGVTPDVETIVYCHVGERSALVWFVLSELLDHRQVANYDGSWIEWGNLVDAPVETDPDGQ